MNSLAELDSFRQIALVNSLHADGPVERQIHSDLAEHFAARIRAAHRRPSRFRGGAWRR